MSTVNIEHSTIYDHTEENEPKRRYVKLHGVIHREISSDSYESERVSIEIPVKVIQKIVKEINEGEEG